MVKAILIITVTLLSVFAWITLGDKVMYREEIVCHTVRAGETFDSISDKWFELDERRDKCWAEFRYKTMEINEGLTKNGRMLQVGDKVHVIYYRKVLQ